MEGGGWKVEGEGWELKGGRWWVEGTGWKGRGKGRRGGWCAALLAHLVDEVERAPLGTHDVTGRGAHRAHEGQQLQLGRERRGELEQRLLGSRSGSG